MLGTMFVFAWFVEQVSIATDKNSTVELNAVVLCLYDSCVRSCCVDMA